MLKKNKKKKKKISILVMLRKKIWAKTFCHKCSVWFLLFTTTSPTPPKQRGKRCGNKKFTHWKYCRNGMKPGKTVMYNVENTFSILLYLPQVFMPSSHQFCRRQWLQLSRWFPLSKGSPAAGPVAILNDDQRFCCEDFLRMQYNTWCLLGAFFPLYA